jgi:hypothetical protein
MAAKPKPPTLDELTQKLRADPSVKVQDLGAGIIFALALPPQSQPDPDQPPPEPTERPANDRQ